MAPHDRFFRAAWRNAYLNSIERWGLRDLVEKWAQRPLDDRDTAAVPELREDGAHLVKLTLGRLDHYAAAYDRGETWTAQQFSFPAE